MGRFKNALSFDSRRPNSPKRPRYCWIFFLLGLGLTVSVGYRVGVGCLGVW